jgi:hypothetical protein
MQKIMHDSIQQLLEIESTPKVTIYIPLETSAAPPSITENQIRFKNLIHKAISDLPDRGEGAKLRKKLRDFLEKTHDDLEFWKNTTRGMLILAADSVLEMFDLPVDTEEYVAVDDTFHLAPVLALLGDYHEYYVLALARQHPKIYKGDMYGLELMDIGLPANLRDGLGIDELNQQIENQGSAIGGSGMKTGGYNGRGGTHDLADTDRMRFFNLVDKKLSEHLDRNIPMILAGIDAENAEFMAISKHPKLLKGTINGNHTESRPEELFDKALLIVREELINPEHEAAREEYERLQGANPDRVARGSDQIQEAAEQGRIDKLLAMMSRNTTDTVQDKVESVFRITFPEPGSSKVLNKLAQTVWRMKGRVLSLLPHEMPNGDIMVARLRY